jgi:23S rRNA (adenine2030-N6)-methyltransferase
MNYRHAFHAGNFADVVKHATLARILIHLLAKPAAFRVIDTHAGAGLYDLRGEEASRSGEWHAGIERLVTAPVAPAARELLKPYLDVVAALNDPFVPAKAGTQGDNSSRNMSPLDSPPSLKLRRAEAAESIEARKAKMGRLHGNERKESASPGTEIEHASPQTQYALTTYPGSPALARAFLRAQDRLLACELEPKAYAALAHNLARDRRIKTVAIDGWVALNAYVPPPERRGVVVIDPPYEDAEDFIRLAQSLELAHRKWASGIYLLWYPIKGRQEPDALARSLKRSGIASILRVELAVAATLPQGPLGGCGLIIVNPPWTLADELSVLLPALAKALSSRNSNHRLDWITGEN